ncbi:MAG TPA: SAM-dependent methyltransferase [Plantibacter sp.]|uniref:SAM-dependent methyltransferase n=1 Tax=unclassified Plantibacter TaxID=2624265 RepID=UPI002B67DFE0|nr:SAM-dependent methyltransferase [Plantibacter sp.]
MTSAPTIREEAVSRTFEDLVAEADAASVDGWDFSWLDGRASEERPSWRFSELLGRRLAGVDSSLDLETGGGEVLDTAQLIPTLAVATESWPPNLARAAARLHPRGVVVVRTEEGAPLPFADGSFQLVSSRHPVSVDWYDVARVIAPGGSYLAQHVGPSSVFELIEVFLGPQPESVRRGRHPDDESAGARAAGLEIVQLQTERLRIEFADVGAIVWFLRKVIWMVPGFTSERYLGRLRELDASLRHDGPFVAHSSRTLIEARKPL